MGLGQRVRRRTRTGEEAACRANGPTDVTSLLQDEAARYWTGPRYLSSQSRITRIGSAMRSGEVPAAMNVTEAP